MTCIIGSISDRSQLGRGGRNKSRENPGIAKKGGLTPAKIFLVDLSECTEANLKW